MDNIEKDIAQGYADFADDEGSTAVGTFLTMIEYWKNIPLKTLLSINHSKLSSFCMERLSLRI